MPLARRLPFVAIAVAISVACAVLLTACGTATKKPSPAASAASSSGKYYKDDGPGLDIPANLDSVPDAVPWPEPLHRFANRPYTVFGREYVPATFLRPYKERGIASWYGRKFHGEKTANGETYDMYKMTAAHPTLPLPSYAKVTNLANGKSVVVRINDRGPFLNGRIIDLSYAAAYKIGIAQKGSGEVEVEAVLPGASASTVAPPLPPVVAAAAPSLIAPLAPPIVAAPANAVASAQSVVTTPLPAAATLPPGSATAATPSAGGGLVPSPLGAPPPSSPGAPPPTTVPAISAPATAVAIDAAAPGPVTSTEGGYVVQLGAFASNANAENFVAHLANQLAPTGVEPKIRQVNGLFRVFVGPYAVRDDARRTSDRLRDALGLPSVIAVH